MPGAHYELVTQIYAGGSLRMQENTALTANDGRLPATLDITAKSVGQ